MDSRIYRTVKHNMDLLIARNKAMRSTVEFLKMEVEKIQLELRIKRLDHRYSRLLRKENPSWEEKMELETIQLELRIKRLDNSYSRLLRKENPSWEEMTELLTELRKITNANGLDRVKDYKERIQSIKRKVLRLQREGKLQKHTQTVITNHRGLGLAVQLMKTEAPVEVDDSDETEEEIAQLRDRLETLDWEYEYLLHQEHQSVDEMQALLEELKILKGTKGIEKVPNYQGYFDSIKAKVLRIYMQGKLTRSSVGGW